MHYLSTSFLIVYLRHCITPVNNAAVDSQLENTRLENLLDRATMNLVPNLLVSTKCVFNRRTHPIRETKNMLSLVHQSRINCTVSMPHVVVAVLPLVKCTYLNEIKLRYVLYSSLLPTIVAVY